MEGLTSVQRCSWHIQQLPLRSSNRVNHNDRRYYYYSLEFFPISLGWWSFTGDWVAASLLRSPGLFSVFWPFSIMLLFWMVSTRPPTSKSSRPFYNPLVTVPKAPITTGIIVTFVFHNFFNSLARSMILISLFTYFQFYSVVSWDSKVDNFADFLFFVDYYYYYYYYLKKYITKCSRKGFYKVFH